MLGVRGFLDAPQAQGERQQAERQVDQEDALPAGMLHQQAAEQRAEDQRQRAEGGPAADHLGALAGIVESLGKDRQRAGYQQRPGDALTARPNSSSGSEVASAQSSEPKLNRPTPSSQVSLRP